MIRFLGFTLLAFLLPFAAYALWRLWRDGTVPRFETWPEGLVLRLAGVGALFMLLAIAAVLAVPPPDVGGVYHPAHIVDGVIVPGRFE